MTGRIGQSLRDVSVLLVDEQSFRRDYVSDVLAAAGGTVWGAFADRASALELLSQASELPKLAYIGSGIASDREFAAELARFGVHCVAIWAEAFDPSPLDIGSMMLRPPLAAFQVVEALGELHRQCLFGMLQAFASPAPDEKPTAL